MSILETLKKVIDDNSQPAAERERAVECLRLHVEVEQYFLSQRPGDDPRIAAMCARVIGQAEKLWEQPEDYVIAEIKKDGLPPRIATERKKSADEKTESIFAEALPPTPSEKVSFPFRQEQPEEPVATEPRPLTFEERYHPAEVERRVNRIIAEAKAQQEREQGKTII